jgi:hypothetical protein
VQCNEAEQSHVLQCNEREQSHVASIIFEFVIQFLKFSYAVILNVTYCSLMLSFDESVQRRQLMSE